MTDEQGDQFEGRVQLGGSKLSARGRGRVATISVLVATNIVAIVVLCYWASRPDASSAFVAGCRILAGLPVCAHRSAQSRVAVAQHLSRCLTAIGAARWRFPSQPACHRAIITFGFRDHTTTVGRLQPDDSAPGHLGRSVHGSLGSEDRVSSLMYHARATGHPPRKEPEMIDMSTKNYAGAGSPAIVPASRFTDADTRRSKPVAVHAS